jgi:diketogulonate reductase-like aldo/keto reductase
MPAIPLPMPRLIYGTAWKKDQTTELVTKALKHGFKAIDTACQPKHYDEAGVGAALQKVAEEGIQRTDLYIQTKFTPLNGQDPTRIPYSREAPLSDQVAESFEVSKKNLGTNYLDGLILHSPLEDFERTMIAWKAMEKIHQQKEARQLGISNCYDLTFFKKLHEAAEVKPTMIQNRFCQQTGYDKEMRTWCKKQAVIYQSFWTLTANPHLLQSQEIQNLAQIFSKTPEQIFFRALIQAGIVPLTGTCSDKHMKDDLAVLEFKLPESAVEIMLDGFLSPS